MSIIIVLVFGAGGDLREEKMSWNVMLSVAVEKNNAESVKQCEDACDKREYFETLCVGCLKK
jgi:hypothetical protein